MINIPYDKALHFGAGVVISALVGILFSPFYGICAAAIAGVGKEAYDYVSVKYLHGSHTVDAFDALVTFAGGMSVTFILMCLGY